VGGGRFNRHLTLGPPVQLCGAAGAGPGTAGWAAVLDGQQSLLGQPVEVEGGHPPADADRVRRRVPADCRPAAGDDVEHGPPGRVVEGSQGGDAV
jgi:hypothetical protein